MAKLRQWFWASHQGLELCSNFILIFFAHFLFAVVSVQLLAWLQVRLNNKTKRVSGFVYWHNELNFPEVPDFKELHYKDEVTALCHRIFYGTLSCFLIIIIFISHGFTSCRWSWSFGELELLLPVMERGSSVVQGDKDVWVRYVRLLSFSLFPFFF